MRAGIPAVALLATLVVLPPRASVAARPLEAPIFGYAVLAQHPHDRSSFTEGLAYTGGSLLESNGWDSTLRKVVPASGRVVRRVALPRKYSVEGVTVLGGRVYLLTWTQHTAFVFAANTLRRLRTFRYHGEGWGLATDGRSLVMSNGSGTLTFRDPKSFRAQRTVDVTDGGKPVEGLNELEVIRGKICANVFPSDRIACIDPRSGEVAYWIDLAGLLPPEQRQDEGAVANGIAFDPKRGRIFVTGKLWPRLYQIRARQAGLSAAAGAGT